MRSFTNFVTLLGCTGAESPTLEKRVSFDASSQLVDVHGDHAFQPPGPHDRRGPCPGLNSLANHGYLPRNGITSVTQAIDACQKAFGMGYDLAAALAIYSAAFDGNLATFSIGGPSYSLLGLDLLGTPKGLSGSHNVFEGDNSPTRGDLYVTYSLQIDRFQALWDLGKEDDNYDLVALTKGRVNQFQHSVETNPYFFYAPFSGMIANPAAWVFIYRLFGNKSEEYPEGRTTGDLLKTFFSVSGEDGNFEHTPGHERIPENFYKNPDSNQYGLIPLFLDSYDAYIHNPEFESIGGNTGEVNSFTGISFSNLTEGIFNADTLLEGNNLFCFALQLALASLPDLLDGLVSDLTGLLHSLSSDLGDLTDQLTCAELKSINLAQFENFPGYTQKYDNYDGAD
ncbi:Cloroperoxidase [Hortaea werneckii]|nr:Cloroperoxidase [Hortaea werneckii]KAI7566598.1 Cloroperoxidase [Hortaea werneckii]KAI7619217.1 Cloroperoxidase [Hortaea werneckii]KAI7622767.1 Cloroperoxidase [Hortaea werneckii]KAI7707824.1 Cloroperoxidase [Hortaea werneckii]